jgi:hypothetical protein
MAHLLLQWIKSGAMTLGKRAFGVMLALRLYKMCFERGRKTLDVHVKEISLGNSRLLSWVSSGQLLATITLPTRNRETPSRGARAIRSAGVKLQKLCF